MTNTQYNPHGYSDSQLWCLGLGAILAQDNGEPHDRLQHLDKTDYKQLLKAWWDVTGRNSLLETVDWLRTEGHRVGFMKMWGKVSTLSTEEWQTLQENRKVEPRTLHRMRVVKHYDCVLNGSGITAWDLARVVSVIRMGVTAGYVEEDEAWDMIYHEADAAQQIYENWYQFAQEYMIGRQYTMRNLDDIKGLDYLGHVHQLLVQPDSPWQRYAQFDLPLPSRKSSAPQSMQ